MNFDIRGVSPVSAQSPLAPAVTKLWNSPNPYYMQDYTINGVRWLPCQRAARMAGPPNSSSRVCGVLPGRGRSGTFPRVRDPGALNAPDPWFQKPLLRAWAAAQVTIRRIILDANLNP